MDLNKQLVTIEESKKKAFKTQAQREEYQKEYKRFVEQNNKEVLLELGLKLKKIREMAGVTQEELAKQINTDKGNISRMEHGRQNLTVEYIVKVANVLHRPVKIDIS